MKFSGKAIKLVICAALVSVVCTLGAFAAGVGVGTVMGDVLRIRESPSTSATVLSAVVNGEKVAVVDELSGWYKVAYGGVVGYMSSEYLSVSKVESADLGTAMVNGTNVRMRSGPGTDYSIVTEYGLGVKVPVIGINNGWFKVSTNAGTGYILSDYITYESGVIEKSAAASASSSNNSPIVATAMNYLGVPYVWAGASPSGFDCSGFTYYVFKENGYTLNRVAYDQYYGAGTYVDKANLQPGDLVFFTSSSSSIGHVGIYIGNNEFIHASSGSSYSVIISSLGSDNYTRRYVGAKRVA